MSAIKMFLMGVCCVGLSHCQDVAGGEYELRAEIVDDSGLPVPEAAVRGAKLELSKDSPALSKNVRVESFSGVDGIASLKFRSIPTPGGVSVQKNGFYSSFYPVSWKSAGNGKYEGHVNAILKPVKNPIPMHATLMTGQTVIIIPEMNKEFGYDLQMAAMVSPFGKGTHADLLIKVEGDYRNKNGRESKFVAKVRFADENDGLCYFATPDRDHGPSLLGDYQAPEKGYINPLEIPFDSSENERNMSRKDEGNYYFRCRTVRDRGGRVIRSNYGKIHGDLVLWSLPLDQGGVAQISWIASYFNPTPNDRNVEFDLKRNLNREGNVKKP